MRRAPAEDEREAGDDQVLERYGNGGFIILNRLDRGRGVEILGQGHEAGERRAALERLLLAAKPGRALDILFDGGAALPRERILVALQPVDRLRPRQRLAFSFAVELRDQAIELVEGAAEALSVLLGELGQLRADERAQQSDRQSQSPKQHLLPLIAPALILWRRWLSRIRGGACPPSSKAASPGR